MRTLRQRLQTRLQQSRQVESPQSTGFEKAKVAGLDVFEQEPPDRANPLLRMDNVILTPHVASASARMDPVRWRRVGHEVALVLRGRWPMSCVNPSVLDGTGLVRWQPYPMERGPGA